MGTSLTGRADGRPHGSALDLAQRDICFHALVSPGVDR